MPNIELVLAIFIYYNILKLKVPKLIFFSFLLTERHTKHTHTKTHALYSFTEHSYKTRDDMMWDLYINYNYLGRHKMFFVSLHSRALMTLRFHSTIDIVINHCTLYVFVLAHHNTWLSCKSKHLN